MYYGDILSPDYDPDEYNPDVYDDDYGPCLGDLEISDLICRIDDQQDTP